jgi:two-component system NtrC family sensor kinase
MCRRSSNKREFDVIRVLEEALLLRDYDMKVSNIQLERDFNRSIPAICGDPHQFEQVFLNIINNAVDAIVEHGECDVRRLKVRVAAEDNRIVIQFQDSGPGFKEPSRIFEPFYTTKGVGKGTGLGLSICYGIVQEHGGEISARNAESGGAIIELRLPAAGPVRGLAEPAPRFHRRQGVLEGTILVVEDEEAVLEFERDVLSGAGARVFCAATLERMRAALAEESFDAVIMNGKMPGSASVADIRRWIAENWPQLALRLLFTFSSLAEPEVRSLLEENQVPFLVKPFEIGDLIAHARKLLAKTRSAAAG